MPAPDDAEFLRLYLAERDVPCPKCGYNLRACVSGMCSECGAGIRTYLHPVVKMPGSWTAGIAGLWAGVALSLIVSFIAMSRGPSVLIGGVAALAYSLAGLTLWNALHRRTKLKNPAAIRYLVMAAWLGVAIAVMTLAAMILRYV